MICSSSPALGPSEVRKSEIRGPLLHFSLGTLLFICALAAIDDAKAKSAHRPRVYADASLVNGLVATPLPNYPLEAVKKKWGGLGVFELRFRPDGTVRDVVTVLTTEHQLLDETARAALWQWRSTPHAQSSSRLTMTFSIHHDPVTINPPDDEALKNIPVHPTPTYPLEARRQRWVGRGLFVMRFRPDGGVKQVVALHSTDHAVLDQECIRTFLRWRCLPGVYTSAYIPISFSIGR